MPNQGNIYKGIIISLIVPFVGYAVILMIVEWFLDGRAAEDIFHQRTLFLVSICFNIIVINFFKSRKEERTLKGALMTTMGLAVAWIIYFAPTILS